MRFKIIPIIVFCFGLLVIDNSLKAQDKNDIDVLVVPFNQISFKSRYPLPELSEVNQFYNLDSIFSIYQNKFLEEISATYKNYQFIELPERERMALLRQLPKIYKKKPTTHMGFDLEKIVANGHLKNLLQNFSVDYLLLITEFEIRKKTLLSPKSFEGSKFTAWSSYHISYEVFDRDGNLIAMDNNFTVKPTLPTESNYMKKGLDVNSLSRQFVGFQRDIAMKIKKYKGKPIYRLRKKDYR